MYINSKFDEYLKESRAKGNLSLPTVSIQILRNYNDQRMDNTNPFNVLPIVDIDINENNFDVCLDFLYNNGVKQIIWSDSSTASLRNLALLVQSRKYRLNVLDSTIWTGKYNQVHYGLLIEIAKRRK